MGFPRASNTSNTVRYSAVDLSIPTRIERVRSSPGQAAVQNQAATKPRIQICNTEDCHHTDDAVQASLPPTAPCPRGGREDYK